MNKKFVKVALLSLVLTAPALHTVRLTIAAPQDTIAEGDGNMPGAVPSPIAAHQDNIAEGDGNMPG
jgi:hypothetical protein